MEKVQKHRETELLSIPDILTSPKKRKVSVRGKITEVSNLFCLLILINLLVALLNKVLNI